MGKFNCLLSNAKGRGGGGFHVVTVRSQMHFRLTGNTEFFYLVETQLRCLVFPSSLPLKSNKSAGSEAQQPSREELVHKFHPNEFVYLVIERTVFAHADCPPQAIYF